ncbi:PREDICTED: ATP-dependent DNA helicase RecQ-like isoform X2 [Acropora digitifera]|uniref:ATP-dependent DNA helicase RecQ-like isoform X2 n=1 Tax=Acropora digitifera TaxID=70779 RepID=UPI00077AFE62|nr:PREDICTED: ATP-dependent DNA helicase RecQ-like isoform X2 [Acropora digitifera]
MIQCCLQGQEGQRIPRSIWAASILLSLCKPVKPLLALTGIADKGTTQAIISSLGLKEARVELFLGRNAYFPTGSFQMADCIIGIYYSMTWQENKERIITSLKGEGNKCVINATSALSMGVHFPDVRYVVHWGPARNLLDYHHQSGRAGRDGLSSYVVVIYHG